MPIFIPFLLGLSLSHSVLATPLPISLQRFDAATSVAMDGVFSAVRLLTAQTEAIEIHRDIKSQLSYLLGTLNGRNSGAELSQVEIKISAQTPLADGISEILYEARFLVGWNKSSAVPPGLRVALPTRADVQGQKAFFRSYGQYCAEEDHGPFRFFYYIRPEKTGCPLRFGTGPAETVSYALLTLKPSSSQSAGKYPEYDRIWADGKLVATLMFGTYDSAAMSDGDEGIQAYNRMYSSLKKLLGPPQVANVWLNYNAVPGRRHPDMEMTWQLSSGEVVNINLLLIDRDSLVKPTNAFKQRYNARSQISDYISYSGHSGMGANIRALTKMGTFVQGQYQIFFINGCDTFFYVDDSLRAAHEAANPGSKPYEFFDVITNAMPSPFAQMANQNLVVLSSLIRQEDSYRQLLSRFHPYQRAIVMGEEDNQFQP